MVGLIGAVVVGRLTVQMLLFTTILVGRSWWRYREVPLQSVPVPRSEWNHQQVVRVGVLPDSDAGDEAIRQHLTHRRRERAREETLLPWLCWPMAGLAALIAVAETQPGYLPVAAGWIWLERRRPQEERESPAAVAAVLVLAAAVLVAGVLSGHVVQIAGAAIALVAVPALLVWWSRRTRARYDRIAVTLDERARA